MNRLARRRVEARGASLEQMLDASFSFNGYTYFPTPLMSMPGNKVAVPDGTFDSLVGQVHRNHAAISAAAVVRGHLLSQLRFQWRSLVAADNGRLWGDQTLGPLEAPNDSQTRADLLMLAELHVSYSGNAFFWRQPGTQTIRLLNPDWVSVIIGSDQTPENPSWQKDAEVVGYWYTPGGPGHPEKGELLDVAEVAHWKPEPDPANWWRGASWVQAVLSEYIIDRAAQTHTRSFLENGATPQLIFTFDPSVTSEQMRGFSEAVERGHAGAANAYRSLFVGGGADAKVVGSDLSRVDLRNVTGLSETRIAVRSRVPAVVLGVSEGLGGSALNAGNYQQTRRQFSDGWFSPTAASLCATLAKLVPPPAGSELWFDPAHVMFLQDDRLDEAQIRQQEALTIRQLIDAGFEPATVVPAVTSGDFSQLQHTGLFSVQLQPPGTGQPAPPDSPGVPTNG